MGKETNGTDNPKGKRNMDGWFIHTQNGTRMPYNMDNLANALYGGP